MVRMLGIELLTSNRSPREHQGKLLLAGFLQTIVVGSNLRELSGEAGRVYQTQTNQDVLCEERAFRENWPPSYSYTTQSVVDPSQTSCIAADHGACPPVSKNTVLIYLP